MTRRVRRSFSSATVVITGGAGGLGFAVAEAFGNEGARVALLDMDPRVRERAVQLDQSGTPAVGIECDITDSSQCEAALNAVRHDFGPVDVLINNAGVTHRSAFRETDIAVYRRVMDVNYFGALHCTKAALADLERRKGLIITVSSIAGIAPLLGRTGYSASKHALHGLFGSLRSELGPTGVSVLLVCPGFTATEFRFRALGGDGQVTNHPQSSVGSMATPRQVAGAIVRAARRDRQLLVLSAAGRTSRWLYALAPKLYERSMARALRSELHR
jgi:NAD(P)-dependent dehydrogenase (short-subunit alcohol dehydrogenase family)